MSEYFKNTQGKIYRTYGGKKYDEADTKATKKEYEAQEKADAVAYLKKLLAPKRGQRQTVYTLVHHVSKSGMTRHIGCYVVNKKTGELVCIDWHISKVTGYTQANRGLVVGGCGMDMGSHLVYTLGRYLWPKGTPKPHGTRNGAPDSDGGYSIKQAWI